MFWNKKQEREGLIEYIEQEAKVLAAFQIECLVVLERARDILMNILLGGAGGALAFSISLLEKSAENWLVWGTFVTSIYLFSLAGVIITGFGRDQGIVPLGNEPKNLHIEPFKSMSIISFKEMYLSTRQDAIEANRLRNIKFGKWLDSIRLLTAITPVWFIFSYLINYFLFS